VAAVLAAISLAGLAASEALGLWWADAIAALIVSVIVLREGWSSLGATSDARSSATPTRSTDARD
jgi:divalent metal cation (Fe/Co/Zn/Cd) transporter